MTEKEKQLIQAYIPSPKDTSLEAFEYYVKDTGGAYSKGGGCGYSPARRGDTHSGYDGWERLRKIQEEVLECLFDELQERW